MKILLLIIIGLVGGVLGGMGMGGGTLLIPLLTSTIKMDIHLAQSINMIAFIPMSIIAIILHIKNKLIDYKSLYIVIPALITSVVGAVLNLQVKSKIVSVIFGVFLIVLGAIQLFTQIYNKIKQKHLQKKTKD